MEIKTESINFFVKTLTANNISCVDIHRHLVTEWGEDNIPSLRQIQSTAKEYRNDVRVSVKRKPGSGQPRSSASASVTGKFI